MRKKVKIFKFAIFFIFCFLVPALYAQAGEVVRVAIIQDAQSLSLKVKGFYEVVDPKDNKVLYRGKDLLTTVTVYKNGILLGKMVSRLDKLLVRAEDPYAVMINGRKFRGGITLAKKDNLHLLVVNSIELEDYIKGILYHEASHYWPLEALKAQAIASRSYAVYQKQASSSRDFDLTSDVYSQVYGGRTSERYRTNIAVDETKGMLLMYQGKILPAYFHATCAGHTEDANRLWNINIAPLKGVVCNFCQESPHFFWHVVLSLEEIEKKLKGTNYAMNNIEGIIVVDRDQSNRIINLKLFNKDKSKKIPAKDFRSLIGADIIRSTNFQLDIAGKDVVIEGKGWGHGVGLCQWGAYFMAKNGSTYQDILAYYYPGSVVNSQ
ncbi:MAG: SpoIID/LytB domain-containing protein [Candidatus Omnitrophica bacterium]|jgi:stage II sporulation protein D|nr:SpoIID/LytB domain-containing protein [Candidatus Omnitrophota bacterium]